MKCRNRVCVFAVGLAVSFAVVSPATAQVVLSNRPWTDEGGPCMGLNGTNETGVRFTVPGGSPYSLNQVVVKIHEVVGGATAQMALYDDANGATQPGNLIATLGTQVLGSANSFQEYTFPGGGQTLDAGTTYWLGLTVLDPNTCAAGWDQNGASPTGTFTYQGAAQFWSGAWGAEAPVDVEIDAAPAFAAVDVPTIGTAGAAVLVALLAVAGVIALRRVWT